MRYLGILPSIIRYDVLHPYKLTVLRELAEVLDDPKRVVRREAVDARYCPPFKNSIHLVDVYGIGQTGRILPLEGKASANILQVQIQGIGGRVAG